MGSEVRGNHADTLSAADVEVILPQYGITESLNVSVASGVLMAYLDMYLQKEGREKFTLPPAEQERLLQEWFNRHAYGVELFSPLVRVD
jgi:tRNA (guanosine-2'-O-)-methyltransferase